MSNAKFLYFNLVDQDFTDIVGGDENAAFPALNIKDSRSTKVYRSNVASDNVVFDFKTVEAVDTVAIRANFKTGWGFNGDLTIEANATANFSSPAFSTTITPDNKYNFSFTTFTDKNYRFWRISGSGSQYLEIANIFIGKAHTLSKNISLNWKYNNNDQSSSTENRYGQKFTDVITSKRDISASIKLMNSAEIDTFNSIIDYLGESKPLWLIMDESALYSPSKNLFAGIFHFKKRPALTNIAFGIYNTSISLGEQV